MQWLKKMTDFKLKQEILKAQIRWASPDPLLIFSRLRCGKKFLANYKRSD